MRLIDADKFEAFVIRTNGGASFVNGVQYVLEKIDNAPTVDAMPRERIYKMLNEIQYTPKLYPYVDHIDSYIKTKDVLDIIHKYCDKEET